MPLHSEHMPLFTHPNQQPPMQSLHALGDFSITARLSLGQDQKLQYGPSFPQLDVLVQPQTAERLFVKITPEGEKRWTVPESIVPRCVLLGCPDTSSYCRWCVAPAQAEALPLDEPSVQAAYSNCLQEVP